MDAPFPPELLLQHGRFVRLLAYHLLRDANAADDVAQEAWLRMLRQPSLEEGRVRPWLRRVVTNLARNHRRAEANQRARQQGAARPEALPSVVEEFEKAELLRAVIEAVLALEEPFRSTILCRYFRGWDAPRLAEETDTSLSTVRSREHRALEKLRAVLDRKEGGRAAWALALGTLVDLPLPSAIPPAPSLAPALATGLGLFAALGLGAWLVVRVALPSSAAPSSAAVSSPSAALVAPPLASPALAQVPTAPLGSAPTARRSFATSETGTSSSSAPLTAGVCEVRGRFLLPGGAPAAGVTVHISGWVGNDEKL
jgi:RNA polymerase sigma-70 factor (ECF subfamily)